ncbi:DNRLRE domain-containing protein [Micromonospora chaiyaphumensis]|uniref:RHS repeat-associated core domain-containing protein n=1 Tax=Micromonospora chaiyaphumensis TaxID=307119 RepID=A0A1C4UVX1_9ACTN|nr:DNRLRE domain-containing protein [Micromonospora chaiyaphumensis]SCE75814.1 RHS repeat-associated core domain-containing protein [Micromonospora chaiyaphumensis]
MRQRLRGPLVVALVLALVATLGGMEVLRRSAPERSSTASAGNEESFLDRLGRGARQLVNGGRAKAPAEAVSAGLYVAQKPPAGVRKKPAKRVKELTGRRTATTRVFAMSDGRLQAEISAAPRHYRDAKGNWQPIDTTVSPSTADGFAAANTTNTFRSRFGASTAKLARFELDGQQVTLGLAGAPRTVKPVLKGDTVTYPGIADGVDLAYDVTATALKERLVLRAPSAASALTFTLEAGALRVAQRDDGSIEFRSPVDNRVLLVMPAPFMFDSKADAGSPYGFAYSQKVTQALRADGGRWAIDVTADKGWLADPKRVFPVTVDPTIKIQPTPSQSMDAMITSDSPGTNFDGNWRLSVGTTTSSKARSLVKFDLTGIPSNTTIDAASLQMYFDQTHTSDAYDVPIEARQVTAPWQENNVTWNSISASMGIGAATSVTVDDTDTAKTAINGDWPASGNTAYTKYGINGTYKSNKNNVAGETFTWVPTVPEDGNYTVDAHYVTGTDRSTAARYTVQYAGGSAPKDVNQQAPGTADWATLGTFPFTAGTTGRVVLGDAGVSTQVAVIADAVRLTKAGAVKKANESSVWHSYPVTNLVQSWVNGTANNGFMLKAADETNLGRGGPRYEAAEYAYNGENENTPKLVVNYGKPGVTLEPPTKIYSTGAQLKWSGYTGDDIVEYQVHRSIYQNFTPSAATLVAPVAKNVTSYTDTTATPTPVDSTDPFGQVYYYQIAVKAADGSLIGAPTQIVRLPRAGRVVQLIQGDARDTTLSSSEPNSGHDVLAGNPWLMVGNNSGTYGKSRAAVSFPDVSTIPANAQVLDAEFDMWSVTTPTPAGATYEVHTLNTPFDEATASWSKPDAATSWTAGGAYDPAVTDTVTGNTDDPAWRLWRVKDAVQSWVNGTKAKNGFLVKLANETSPAERTIFLSSEAAEPQLRPKLVVTYIEPTPASTYYAPDLPQGLAPGSTNTVPVTVTNPTTGTWRAGDWQLSYRWARADGTRTDETAQAVTALPKDVLPGEAVTVSAALTAPASTTEGNKRTDYVLRWELYNKTSSKWLSEVSPIASLDQNVAVVEPTSDQLGLEKFYSYAGKNTGAGGTLMNNLYAGNSVWSYDAFSNPGRGLSTFVRLAYNSLDTSDTVAGYGWSLQASSMMRLGSPLDLHPNPNPTKVTLTDGDGTSHWFTWDAATSTWKSPKGVHLYLEKVTTSDCKPNTQEPKAWRLTKPDRTQFYYDCEGFLTSTVDNNGNEMVFTYEERKSNNKPTKFLRYITDPAGRKTLTIDYYAKGQTYDYINDTTWTRVSNATNLTNPKIIDHVRQVTDVSGRKMTFTYTDKGLLGELVDGYGSSGTMGAPKTFKFAYDMTQGNKNVKLVKITDPRANAAQSSYATTLAYNYPQAGDDPKFHWTTKSYTDRLGKLTQFGYVDPDGPQGTAINTTVTDAENHTTRYQQDGYGRPYETTNAKNQVTKLGWDNDHNVTTLTEDNGAVSTWDYDTKTGYPTEIKDAEAVKNGWPGTTLTYQYQLNGYVADLVSKTSPKGRKWTFGYEADGDLSWVVDPIGNTTSDPDDYKTTYTYDAWGQMLTATDANGNGTSYDRFDPNGYPQTISDANQKQTKFVYDVRGQVLKVTDALTHDTTQTYDTFGRPLENKVARNQGGDDWITTPAPTYDANDNVTVSTAPNGAVTTASYDEADQLTWTKAPVDVAGDPERKTSFTYDKVGNLLTTTEPKGNLTSEAGDYVTTNGYDEVYQLTSVTNAKNQKITYEYDNVGNVVTVGDPRKNATADTADYTTKLEYDLAHRVTKSTDALGKSTSSTYDRDGLVTATTDQLGNTTEVTLDPGGNPTEVKVPHKNVNGTITYRVTRYEYDEVGNQTKVTSPRGVATTDDPDDFATVTSYDKLNRVKETRSAYDKDDSRYTTADVTTYQYDAVGRLTTLSAPPSAGQTVRNDTTYTYYDNGWTKSSSDPWDIVTSYDYDDLGAQTARTVTSAGGSSNRTMSWSYFPDGKLKSRSDDGVPVGKQVVLVDNSEFNNASATGTWAVANSATGRYGTDYATRPAGTGTNTFTWRLNVPQSGTYEVFARYPQVTGAATDAKYTISHGGGNTPKTVNQSTNAGTWVSLGSYSFTEGNSHKVSLSDQATGTVVADAVKLVRDNTGEADNEKHDYRYRYDPNGNLKTITDASPGARVDDYSVVYTDLNQVQTVTESKSGTVTNTTSFTYNENSAPLTTTHDKQYAGYTYDPRDLVSEVVNGKSATDPGRKTTTFTYTDRGEKLRETKGNGNTVNYTYYLDGLLNTQVEKKPNATVVSEHTYTYDLNGNRTRDVARKMNADNHSAYLNTTSDYTYDPRDRLATLTKTGDGAGTETYVHDANSNVIEQTLKGTTTTYNYDRNRLLTASAGGATSSYNYDPFGRLDTVTAAGTVLERNVYDGFDHVIENRKNNGTSTSTTKYTYDPLDRTATKTTDAGGAKEKTTRFNYLGLSGEVLDEEVAGKLTKSYQYSPWGQRLSQITHKDDGTQENAYYGYDPHTDVEQLTDDTGDTKATYGYTAYGKNDDAQFTGIDKPDAQDPTKEPYNAYRFNAKRWDQSSQSYDMGFRDYSPGLNRFLSRDSYNGALADMNLGLNPFTGNRYAFGGGNPISAIEIDGHSWDEFVDNLTGFGSGFVDGAKDAASGLGQLGYDMFIGSSPFVSEQTRAETKARAEARGDAIKNPRQLWNGIKQPYEEDIKNGRDAHAAGRAVFDLATLFLGGGAGKAGKTEEVASGATNAAAHARYVAQLGVAEAANPLIESLKTTGKLPGNYVTKTAAEAAGYKPGKALNNYVPGAQIGGDIYENSTRLLPSAPGRVYYEADVGLKNTMSRAKQPGNRLVYSNDGLAFVTADHYGSFYQLPNWK